MLLSVCHPYITSFLVGNITVVVVIMNDATVCFSVYTKTVEFKN